MSNDMQDIELTEMISQAIAGDLVPISPPAPRQSSLRARILRRAADAPNMTSSADPMLNTIRGDQGEWLQVGVGVDIKPLFENAEGHSYIVRFQPGSQVPAHPHGEDEECMVLEGELHFGEIHVRAGDYHVARAGSTHGLIRSTTGAMMYVRSAGPPAYRA